jgi:hypothetical protein
MPTVQAFLELRFVIDMTRPLPGPERKLMLNALALAKEMRRLSTHHPLATDDLIAAENHLLKAESEGQ